MSTSPTWMRHIVVPSKLGRNRSRSRCRRATRTSVAGSWGQVRSPGGSPRASDDLQEDVMTNLRITRLGHGGVLYRSPGDAWIWVDRWSSAPNYAEEYREPEKVDVIAPTHCHF